MYCLLGKLRRRTQTPIVNILIAFVGFMNVKTQKSLLTTYNMVISYIHSLII